MTVFVVVVLCVAVVVLTVVALVTRSRLRTQAELTAAADRRVEERDENLTRTNTALEQAERERSTMEERAAAADAEREQAQRDAEVAAAAAEAAAEQARVAEQRAVAANSDREAARREADEARAASERAEQAARVAEEAARSAEQRARDAAAAVQAAGGGSGSRLDPALLWALERSRSERTWRNSVALGPDDPSVFAETDHPLVEALQIELDAAREEVGAVVELDADLPVSISDAGSVLTLRAAQELLAAVVRHSESTTLRVRADGGDVVVTVDAVDEDGTPMLPPALSTSSSVVDVEGGVRISGVIPTPDAESD